jgi:hypothetical protein
MQKCVVALHSSLALIAKHCNRLCILVHVYTDGHGARDYQL